MREKSGESCLVDHLGGPPKKSLRRTPIDTTIGNRNTIFEIIQRTGEGLATGIQVTLDHYGMDDIRTVGHLTQYLLHHDWLTLRILFAIGVTAIDHERGRHLGGVESLFGNRYMLRGIVRTGGTTPKNKLAVGITSGGDGGSSTILGYAKKGLALSCRQNPVDGRLYVTTR